MKIYKVKIQVWGTSYRWCEKYMDFQYFFGLVKRIMRNHWMVCKSLDKKKYFMTSFMAQSRGDASPAESQKFFEAFRLGVF